ncbi:MAG: gliding motility-associated C-terminal domain-containing protein [Chitinophagales bacterium]
MWILLFGACTSTAQIVDDDVFLQGCFIELGISSCGVYGSNEDPPIGPFGAYHGINTNGLGFIADHEKDGWDEATAGGEPNFCGDYFTPGSPEEGWAIEYDGDVWENHYVPCSGYGATGYGGGDIDGDITSYIDAAGVQLAVWEGELSDGGLDITIKQTTSFPNGALFFLTSVEICNVGATDITDLYYTRNVDPDQDVDWCSTYNTTNTVVYNYPSDDTALVTAVGAICGCFLGIGALDPRARVSHGLFYISPATPSDAWSGTGGYTISGEQYCDCAIQITFKVDIPAGGCTTINYAHVLDPSDLVEALEATLSGGVGLTANGVSISASGQYAVCNAGDTVFMEANGDPEVEWHWSPPLYLSDTVGSAIIATPEVTTEYTVTGIGGECGDVTTTFTLIVDEDELADAGADASICIGSSTTLNGYGGPAENQYVWTPATGLSDPNIANPVASPTSTTAYLLTTYDTLGCPATDAVLITVNPLPNINAGSDEAICVDGQVTLGATGGVSYVWSPAIGLDNPNIANPVCTVDEETVYTVTGTDANGCVNTDEMTVSVNYLPEVIAVANPYTIDVFLGEYTQLDVTTGGVQFSWFPPSGLSDANIQNPTAQPQDTLVYTVTVTDAQGCVNSDTVIVYVIGELTVLLPNAFSPNGDGINDYYYPAVSGSGDLDYYAIYNRWGEMIFENTAPNTADASNGWNGEWNGKQAEVGAYVVIARAKTSLDEQQTFNGTFVLIR